MIKVEPLERSFSYLGTRLPDPDPSMTVEQVRDVYVNTYPELATAAVEGPSPENGRLEYTFVRAVGAKG
ncbi:MAG TPA: PRTRC system protein C [Candidatus Angelobacter sp.]|nr:PRTRC system protein C [Candidatus Angelobacter sp.]